VLVLPVGISAEDLATVLGFTALATSRPITAMAAATSSRPMATLGSAIETGLCKEMTHSLREPIENRRLPPLQRRSTCSAAATADYMRSPQTPAVARSHPESILRSVGALNGS